MIKTIALFVMVAGCAGKKDNPEKASVSEMMQELDGKQKTYLALTQARKDDQGWVVAGCDGLLFNSLLSASGAEIPIEKAETEGRWFRTPAKDCLPKGESRSDISRDMLLGLLFHIWQKNDKDALSRLIKYGEDHNWKMGDDDGTLEGLNRTLVSPQLQGTIYQMAYKLHVKDDPKRTIPQVWPAVDDYESHLQMLTILLRGLIDGAIDDEMLKTAKANATREPKNALYQAVYQRFYKGDQTKAVTLLLSEEYFPIEALPTKANYCTDYLYQRNYMKDGKVNPDWMPCSGGEVKPGVDFIFASAVVIGALRSRVRID